MSNFEDDDLDEDVGGIEQPIVQEIETTSGNNRNFLLALGVLGGVFVILIIALVLLFLNRRPETTAAASIRETNSAILSANTQTAGVATQLAAMALTPSVTLQPSVTSLPSTATMTPVVALATATTTPLALAGGGGGLVTITPTTGGLGNATGTIPALLTQAGQLTQTQRAQLTLTATQLPTTGFAEDVGLPGLFGMALGLVVVIVLVRRLRLSSGG